jgi:hypothetical protein
MSSLEERINYAKKLEFNKKVFLLCTETRKSLMDQIVSYTKGPFRGVSTINKLECVVIKEECPAAIN